MFNTSSATTTIVSSSNVTELDFNFTESLVEDENASLTDIFGEIVRGTDLYFSEDGGGDDASDLPDLTNTYLPPYPNPSRHPTVFQNSTNSSTFEFLFQFTPTYTNLCLLGLCCVCTAWVIVMNMMIIGALLKGHRNDKEHITDMYLINLLFADVLLGIFVFPFMSIVILVGYFPFGNTWCSIWVYFDYYLIIASSYGFAALMCSYLMILRWPEYYPRSRGLHLIFILFIWAISNAPWTAPFINDRVSVLYPKGVCGFSIKNNRYFTLYIGFTGFYIPLAISLISGIFAVKYLKQSERLSFFKLLVKYDNCHVHPFVSTTSSSSSPENDDSSNFNDLNEASSGHRNHHHKGCNHQVHFHHNLKTRPDVYPPNTSESTTEDSSDSGKPLPAKKRFSVISVRTFHRTKALQDSVRRHFPLVATSLILFVLSRSLFYTYFGIGSVVPKLFPPDLSHSVYWLLHSYAVTAPVVHLMLDKDLRKSVIRFINEGTFELSSIDLNLPEANSTRRSITDKEKAMIMAEKLHYKRRNNNHCMKENFPKVSMIDGPNIHNNHHSQNLHHQNYSSPIMPRHFNNGIDHINGAAKNYPKHDYFYR